MKKKLIAQSFGARMKNGPHLSRLLDPPGTKGGPQTHFRRGPPKHPLVMGGATTPDQRVFGPVPSRVSTRDQRGGPLVPVPATTRDQRPFSPGW